MATLWKAAANSIAYLYSGIVVLTFLAIATLALVSIGLVIAGLLGVLNTSF